MKYTHNNLFSRSLGLCAAMLLVAGVATAQTTFYVNDNASIGDVFTTAAGDDVNGNGSSTAPYATITNAISMASTGDIIKVDAGIYNEGVTIDKSIIVMGVQSGVCAATRMGSESVISYTGGLGIAADNVTLDGFTIQGEDDPTIGPGFGFGVYMGAATAGTHLINNIIKNNISGASVSNAGTSPAQSVVSCNWFASNNQSGSGSPSGYGIYTDQFVSGGSISNVVISDNKFSGNDTYGMNFGSSDPTLASTGILIHNNDFNGNRRASLFFNLTSSTISANTIRNSYSTSTASGEFFLFGVTNSTFSNNTFTATVPAAIRTSSAGGVASSNLTVTGNSFTGYTNSSKAIIATSGMSGVLNAECNWYGTTNTTTLATLNSANVDYTPWLLSGTDAAPGVPGFQPLPASISLTSAAGTDAQTVCVNTAINNISYATTNTTGATISGLPGGVTGSSTGNIVSIAGTPNTAGTFTYTVSTAGCGSVIATGTLTVVINNVTATTNVSPAYPLSGHEKKTIYLSYPASQQTETIAAIATGGTGPYSYTWTKSSCNSSTMSVLSNTADSYVFAPTTADTCLFNGDNVYTFTVVVKDNYGCTASATEKVNVVNPYVGNIGNSNVLLCHKVAVRGGAVTQLLQVAPNAASAHLAHGDYLGNCPVFIGREGAPVTEQESEEQHVAVYPNPTTGLFVLELSSVKEEASIIITDVAGKLVSMKTLSVSDTPTATFDLSNVAKGMYLIQIKDGMLNYRTKIVVQ